MSPRLTNLLRFAYISLLCSWFVGWQVFLLKLYLAGRLFIQRDAGMVSFSDFPIFLNVWRISLSSSRALVYDSETQSHFLHQLLGDFALKQLPFAQYTPVFILLFSPLSFLGIDAAFACWNLIGAIAYAIALFMSLKVIPVESNDEKKLERGASIEQKIFMLACFASYPFLLNERGGQTGAMVAALAGFFSVAFLRRQDWLAGLCLGLMLIKPTALPFFLAAPLALRRIKILCGMGLTSLVLIASTMFWYSPATIAHYPAILREIERDPEHFLGVFTKVMVNFKCLISYFLPESASLDLAIVLMGVAIIALILLGSRIYRKQDKILEAQLLSLSIITAALFSPHIFTHDLLMVSIAAALTWESYRRSTWKKVSKVNLWRWLFISYPIFGMLCFIAADRLQNSNVNSVQFFLDLALLYCGISIWFQSQKLESEASPSLQI